MSTYFSRFITFSLKRWILAVLSFFYRLAIGPVADRVFDWANIFEKKSSALPPVRNPLLLDSALSLAAKIRTRQVSSVNVVRAYVHRIEEVNPMINAVVDDRFREALEEAARVDKIVCSGQKSEQEMEMDTPLLGVPLSIKEAIAVEGMLFTTGVVRRRGVRAEEDADVVTSLRRAGAIPIGVTNTSEQCFWMEAYNNLYGRTNNPYDLSRSPGGSSGGEGALLASAGSVIGVGNDIGGSIRIPSFFNGVFGHKPSRGIVPNRGHFPPTEPILQQYIGTGPMCRYASDLKVMLKVMAGPNAHYLQLDKEVSLKSLKIYYMENDGDSFFTQSVGDGVKNAVRKVISHFRKICVVPPQRVHIRGLNHGFRVWAYALSAVVADVATIESRVFGDNNSASPLKEFFLSLFGWSQYSLPAIATVLVEKFFAPRSKSEAEPYLRVRRRMEEDFRQLLQDDCVFIMPTLPRHASRHYADTVRPQNCGYVAAFNVLGLPATHCPVGLDEDGLPVGVQVVSGCRNDRLNIAVAREIEREFGGWVCPGPVI